jgi:hypothetical protein
MKMVSDEDQWNAFLRPLVDAGVLVEEVGYARPLDIGDKPQRQQGNWSRSETALLLEDAWFETGRLLGAERTYGCSALPMLRQRSYYEKYGSTLEEHSVWNLVGQYKNLSDALVKIRESSCLGLTPYVVAPIPPIALLLLERSRNTEELIQRSLELRDDYTDLRKSLCSLRAELADPDVMPKSKMRAISSWKQSWSTLDKYKNQISLIEIGNASALVS